MTNSCPVKDPSGTQTATANRLVLRKFYRVYSSASHRGVPDPMCSITWSLWEMQTLGAPSHLGG